MAKGHADPTRVAIMGKSYGGHAALARAALTPDRGARPGGRGPDLPRNRQDWYAHVETFLARCLGGRAEPLEGGRVVGSSAVVREVGADR